MNHSHVMKMAIRGRLLALAASAAAVVAGSAGTAQAGLSITTVVSFNGANGADPTDTLAVGPDGNLYGTTRIDGSAGQGTVFELSGPGFQTLTTLASFSGTSGAVPSARLTFDSAGDVFGTTVGGGSSNSGTVFELSGATHQNLTTLVSFTGSSGNAPGTAPLGGVAFDASGNLYGVTQDGGATGAGTVFELSGTNHQTFTMLHNFSLNADNAGVAPNAQLLVDAAGNLFGTTEVGGSGGGGGVFELSGSNHQTYTPLVSFNGTNNGGGQSTSGLVADASGNLYGTLDGLNGLVYELSGSNHTTLTTLHAFTGYDGNEAVAGLAIDAAGDLYGTTSAGGPAYNPSAGSFLPLGTVFEITGSNHGTFTTLADFSNQSGGGYDPYGGIALFPDGTVYGTTDLGGAFDDGTVFTLSTAVPEPALTGIAAGVALLLGRRGRRSCR
jgi:uncharacterized repeat protein (TIGR03803 family)